MSIPIVVCSVHEEIVAGLAASVAKYCENTPLIKNKAVGATFGESYNAAMAAVFEEHDEIIIANDDITLTEETMRDFMEDLAALKAEHGDKLGMVGVYSDNVRGAQQGERVLKQVDRLSPIFAYVSKKAFEAAQFPPLNWYSDDVMCEDLLAAGFVNFVSKAFVHHIGSATIGNDNEKNNADAMPWLQANRPHYLQKWGMKKPLKIAVYAISKNEEKFVETFCASAAGADLILIADTGSTDGTVAKARECGAVVYDIHIRPWRFDHARNAALALIPGDFDVCISLDLDEVLEPGWREEIERLWTPDTTNLWYLFDWGQGITFPYRKIHSRAGYHWRHPCHEDLYLDPRVEEVKAWSNKVLVTHHPDPTKSRGQYMGILEAAVAEDDRVPQHYFYYARELTFYQRWDEAITALTRYVGMPGANNPSERCYAMRLLGKAYAETGRPWEAEKWFHNACGEAPDTREPWCDLAMFMYRNSRWEECFAFSMRALKILDKKLVYTCDPAVWGFWPHDLAAISAWHLGLIDIAIEQGRKAVELAPDDARLRDNLEWFTGKKAA